MSPRSEGLVAIRAERFGAIVVLREPPALVSIDRALARSLGVEGGALWDGAEPDVAESPLVGPTEVHLAVTERCGAGCKHCYVDATPDGFEPALGVLEERLDAIAALGAFRVAFGGGEATTREDLAELVAHAKARGLEPTLTTSGLGLTRAKIEALAGFAQVNVSYDGRDDVYRDVRGFDGSSGALRTMRALAEAGIPFGVNLVLSRASLASLERTAEEVEALGARELQLLRLKPEGRGKLDHLAMRPSLEDWRSFSSRLRALRERTSLVVRIDCSLVPFLADGEIDPAAMVLFGVSGCEGGRSLATLDVRGALHPCSFAREETSGDGVELGAAWASSAGLDGFRAHHEALPQPCAGCDYRAVCRGGCRVVARVLTGDASAPDPECPRVIASRACWIPSA